MVDYENSELQSKTPLNKKIIDKLHIGNPEVEVNKQIIAMAEAVKYQLSAPEEIGFSLISTKEGFWKTVKSFEGVSISRMTEASNQPNAQWDARRLAYRIKERDIQDNQMAILFLPHEFECTKEEIENTIRERVESQKEEREYSNMLEAVLGEGKELYKPEEWKPSEMDAIIALRKGNILYNMHVFLDNDEIAITPYIIEKSEFEEGEATIGVLIYINHDEESEYTRFNERYGKLLITRKASREEVSSS